MHPTVGQRGSWRRQARTQARTDARCTPCLCLVSLNAAPWLPLGSGNNTGMVRGATKSLVIDLGFVLEGQRPEELPEALLGAFRLNHLDCGQAKRIDTTHELPLLPRPLQQHQLAQMAAAAAAAAGSGARGDMAAANSGAKPEAEAASGFGVGGGQLDQQRRVCSASGATPAVSVAAAAADRAALQQQQQAQARPSSTARNSASVLESGRTMTGHARSR